MGVTMKYNKPITFKETGKGYIVLVESRDPKTKISVLKGSGKKRSHSNKSKGILDYW